MTIECTAVTDTVNDLGEGPVWSARDGALYWVDAGLEPKTILRHRPATGHTDVWRMPQRTASLKQRKSGGLVLGYQRGFATCDPLPGGIRDLAVTGIDFERERLNDSAVDRAGRLWVGSFERTLKSAGGMLYRIDRNADGTLAAKAMDRGPFMISNGIAWSPDDRTMYYTDSRPGRIYAYDYDLATGGIANRRVFMDFTGRKGRPDGCAIDAEGGLWVAEIEAWQLVRIAPDGKVDREVRLPIRKPTSVAFGGERLDELYVTSMTMGLSEAEKKEQPLAGRLFTIQVGVRGLPDPMLDY